MKQKLLLFVVAYNAEDFIESVLGRIPEGVLKSDRYDTEILIVDDESKDRTLERAEAFRKQRQDLKITVMSNERNRGYGGNQKVGYRYAVENGFDAVVLLHGDGQYPPEFIPEMIAPLLAGRADAVLGSRLINRWGALKGGMPVYKWIGNQILTALQNLILGSRLSEFHTGYRAYGVPALASIPLSHNSDYFDFDTDILIQLLDTGKRIEEIPIPTYYGSEVSRVNGLRYGWLILRASLQSRLVPRGFLYHPKFDYESNR